MTSSVTSPIDSVRTLSYRLPIVTNFLYPVVSEIFSLKNGHTHDVCSIVHWINYWTQSLAAGMSSILLVSYTSWNYRPRVSTLMRRRFITYLFIY